ncbi:MAG TPA: hypothetical protein VGM05_16910 [Planctomycetaceae bacterium]|jgi:hypothetical protein
MNTRDTAPQFTQSQSGTSLLRTAVVALIAIVVLGLFVDSQLRRPRQSGVVASENDDANEKPSRAASAISGARGHPPPEIEYFPQPMPQETRVLDALAKTIDVDFQDVPFEMCIASLEKQSGVPIRIDRDRGGPEDRPQHDTVVTLSVKGSSLETVLSRLLLPYPFAVTYEHDTLIIASSTVASDLLITRTYPVSDLYTGRERVDVSKLPRERTLPGVKYPAPPVYSDLEEALVKTIDPDSWSDLSGPGEISYMKESGSLVIRQTWNTHRKTLQLLRDLRAARRLLPK